MKDDDKRALCWHNIKEDTGTLLCIIGLIVGVVLAFVIIVTVPYLFGMYTHSVIGIEREFPPHPLATWLAGIVFLILGICIIGIVASIVGTIINVVSWTYNRYYPPPSKCPDDKNNKEPGQTKEKHRQTNEGLKLKE